MFIGLTGGIAAGKSTVARHFSEHGAIVVDADQLARDVVEPGQPALAEIAQRFGDDVIGTDGRLDRRRLGAVVFANSEARKDLEEITHPAIKARTRQLNREAHDADPGVIVVYDMPLLVETGTAGYDAIVVVDAPLEERVRRMVELRGMTETQALARAAAQVSDDERRAAADYVIDASQSVTHTLDDADRVWAALQSRRDSGVSSPRSPAASTARDARSEPTGPCRRLTVP